MEVLVSETRRFVVSGGYGGKEGLVSVMSAVMSGIVLVLAADDVVLPKRFLPSCLLSGVRL